MDWALITVAVQIEPDVNIIRVARIENVEERKKVKLPLLIPLSEGELSGPPPNKR